jgi:hypothetical protein
MQHYGQPGSPGFPFLPDASGSTAALGGSTVRHSEPGGAIVGPSGLTMPPPPSTPNAAGGLTVALGSPTAYRTETGSPTTTPGAQTT